MPAGYCTLEFPTYFPKLRCTGGSLAGFCTCSFILAIVHIMVQNQILGAWVAFAGCIWLRNSTSQTAWCHSTSGLHPRPSNHQLQYILGYQSARDPRTALSVKLPSTPIHFLHPRGCTRDALVCCTKSSARTAVYIVHNRCLPQVPILFIFLPYLSVQLAR